MKCQSHLFSIPENITYLNCSYMGPLTQEVAAAGKAAIDRKTRPYGIGVKDFFEPVDQLKSTFAQLINASEPRRISLAPSVSYAMSTLAGNLPVSEGENIVTLEQQFPSNVYCWQRLCDQHKLGFRSIEAPQGEEGRAEQWNQRILEAIDEKTAAVAIGTVHWADGTLFDLKSIRAKTREVGAMLILDGTQSIGAKPFDITDINPDAVVTAAYKWLLGPYALALAYYGPAFDNGTPLEESWINRLGSEDFQGLTSYEDQYHPYATRYDMGEKSNFFLLPMLQASMDQILGWGVAEIQDYCQKISHSFVEECLAKDFRIESSQNRAHNIFGIRFPQHFKINRFRELLHKHQVHVSLRGDAVRVSPHLYNHEGHFEKLHHCLISSLS